MRKLTHSCAGALRTAAMLVMVACVWTVGPPAAAEPLTTLHYQIDGASMTVSPAALAVPKGIAGSVLVEVSPNLAAGAFVEATLRGPSFPARRLVGQPNAALLLPPLNLVGDYSLDNIRLVASGSGEVIIGATPASVPVRVFDEVLVSRVTSRPLTLDEIQERGIFIDESNFRAIEFEVGFVIDGETVPVKFPVVAPAFRQSTEIIPQAELEALLAEADRINNEIGFGVELPDELEVAGLNLQIKGIQFQEVDGGDQELELRIPPIPALMVIPGNIGFLNQFFSVMIFTENGSPSGSGLSVRDVRARLTLPPGPDQVAGTWAEPGDDPLRMARLGPDRIVQEIQPVRHPGPDGVLGTDDDAGRLQPGEAGQAEFLVEGLQEGLHVMDLELTASLDGLAAGTVNIKGRAAGSVLVRNPRFSMAFTHPRTIRFGEPYDATVTVLNTSATVANLVNVTLRQASISGGILESAETVDLGTIPPGETRTATFRVRAQRTGSITFSNLTTSDDSLVGRFRLRMGIDERGVALSPDTILMPDFVDDLPPELIAAATRVLGQALSVATAGQRPAGVKFVNRATITHRVLELAEAGQRLRYGDGMRRVLLDLLLDWQGGRQFDAGFDQIVRETDAGREWREALMAALDATADPGLSAGELLRAAAPDLAGRNENWFFAAAGSGNPQFFIARGDERADETRSGIVKTASYGAATSPRVLAAAAPGEEIAFHWWMTGGLPAIELDALVVRDDGTAGGFTWNIANPPATARYRYRPAAGDGLLEIDADGNGLFETTLPAVRTDFAEALPEAISVIQDLSVHAGRPRTPCEIENVLNYGTVLAVLFSKPMSQDSVNVPAAYVLDNGNVAGSVRIQPGGRVAMLNMRLPVGAFIPRTMTIGGIADPRGNPLAGAVQPVLATAVDGISIHGRVVRSDGSFAANVPVTLTMYDEITNFSGCEPFTVRVAQVRTDEEGRFAFDYVMAGIPYSVSATDTSGLSDEVIALILESAAGDEFRRNKLQELADQPEVRNSLLEAFATASLPQAIAVAEGLDRALLRDVVGLGSARIGTKVPVALRFRGRGSVTGQVVMSDGVTPFSGAAVNLFPDPDSRELGRGVFAGSDGRFAFFGVPLGVFDVRASTGGGLLRNVSDILEFPGEIKDVRVVLSSAAVTRTTLRGRVTESDTVTVNPGARVFVGQFDGNQFKNIVAATTADAGGFWEAGGVPVGIWDLLAISYDGRLKGERRKVAAIEGGATFSSIALQGVSTVIGRVLTSTGQPVPNAIVAGGAALVRTDADGFFTLDGVPTGERQISAGLERNPDAGIPFARIGGASVVVLPGVDNFVVIRFDPRGTIIGRVLDAAGNPVPGVRVALPVQGGFFWVNADGAGNYEIPNLGLGSHTVSAPSPPVEERAVQGLLSQIAHGTAGEVAAAMGEAFAIFAGVNNPYLNGEGANFNPASWGFAKTALSFDGQVAVADIRYLRGGTVSGTVINGQGVPIGARVRLTGVGPLANGDLGFVIRGELNSDPAVGTFSFPGQLLAGDWGLQAASPFYPIVITTSGRTTSVDPNATGIVLQFPAVQEVNGRLKGIVLMPDGTPAGPDVLVKISFGDLEVRTVADGTFDTQIAIPAGGYTVEADDPASGLRGLSSIRIQPGIDNMVEVRLLDRGSLDVLVRYADGTPAAGANVEIEGGGFPRERFEGVAAGDGRILFQNIFQGAYAVSARIVSGPTTIRGRSGATVPGGLTAATTVTLTPTGTIRGTFVSRTLEPVTFAQIAVGALGFATTDELGRFEVAGVPLGIYQVVGRDAVTGRFGAAAVTLSSQNQVVDVQLVEQPRGEIVGRVVNSYNTGFVPGATVTLTQPGGLISPRSVTTDPQGEFRFPGTSAGAFTLLAADPVTLLKGTATAILPATATVFQIDLPLQPLATIAGTVFRPDGVTPAENVVVTLGNRTADTGADGRVTFSDLPLGTYAVRARSLAVTENRNAEQIGVSLNASGPAPDFAITLRGVGRVEGQVLAGDGVTPVVGAQVEIQIDSDLFMGTKVTALSDPGGNFVFDNIPVGAFRVTARAEGLGGSFDSSVAAHGSVHQIAIILSASGTVSGRLVRADGITPAAGIDVLLGFPGQFGQPGRAMGRTDENGGFTIGPIPVGGFTLDALAPAFGGIARLGGAISANGEELDLGDVVFDEDDPHVVQVSPEHTADDADIHTTVDLLFNEALDPGRIEPGGIYLRSSLGTVDSTVALLDDGDGVRRLVRITPNAPLRSETMYEVVVVDDVRVSATGGVIGRGPVDRVGRPMVAPFVSQFTTRDQDPPKLLSFTPAPGTGQIDPRAVVRLSFNEPIRSEEIEFAVIGPAGPVAGAVNLGVNGLVLVFTPQFDLLPNATYGASVSGIRDLAGNFADNQPFLASFQTLDTIGPDIAELRIKGGLAPTAGANVIIQAVLAEPETGASVRMTADFVSMGQSQPGLLELPLTLPPTGSVTVRAHAIDRFGNEGPVAEQLFTVVENQPPVVHFQLLAPAAPPVASGQIVEMRVTATDDGAVTGLRAAMSGAAVFPLITSAGGPIILTATVPAQTGPGQRVLVLARATDNAGLESAQAEFDIPVIDGTPPTLAITGPDAGSLFAAGETVMLGLNAGDNFGVSRIDYTVTGAFTGSGSVPIAPQPGTHPRVVPIPIPEAVANNGAVFAVSLTAHDEAGMSSGAQARGFAMRDLVPPVVVSVSPPDGATGVPLQPTVEVRFSKPLDPATVNSSTVSLTPDGGEPVEIAVSLISGNQVIRVQPAGPLEPLTEHHVAVETAVADAVGNPLEETFGSRFTTLLTGAVPPVAGRPAPHRSLRFDGVDDFARVTNVNLPAAGTGTTAELWLRTSRASRQLLLQNLAGIPMGLYLGRFKPGQTLFFFDGSSVNESEDFGPDLSDGQWHHVAGVWEAGVVSIYVDGVLVGVKAENRSATSAAGFIGSDAGVGAFFQGDMTEVRIWNIARSGDEILRDMHRRLDGLEAGLAAYHPMNEATGGSSYDHSIRANDAISGNGNPARAPLRIEEMPPLYEELLKENTPAGSPLTIVLDGHDPSGGPLVATLTALPANGSLFQAEDGLNAGVEITAVPATVTDAQQRVIYLPDDGFTGPDSFSYSLNNGAGGSAAASVRIDVAPSGFATPLAGDDAASAFAGTPKLIDGVLDNDSHPEGQPVRIIASTQPANGTVVPDPDGTFTYTADVGFDGTDTFTYTIAGERDYWRRDRDYVPGAVAFSHQGNPLADPSGFRVWHMNYVRGGSLESAEPWHANPGARLVWDDSWFGSPGTWARANDVNPPVSAQSFTHTIATSDAWQHIPVVRWESPVTAQMDLVGDLIVTWSGDGGVGSPVDVDLVIAHHRVQTGVHQTLLAQTVSKPSAGQSVGDMVVIPVDLLDLDIEAGDFIAVSHRAQGMVTGRWINLRDDLTILPSSASATATVTITVDPNRAPVAGDQRVQVFAEEQTLLALSAHDPDGDPLVASILSRPSNGRLFQFTGTATGAGITAVPASVNDVLRRLIYLPDEDFLGPDSFTFLVNDGLQDSNTVTVLIEVIPPVAPDGNDLWDETRGAVVTAHGGVHQNSFIGNMFGGTGGVEPANTIYADGRPAGFTHFVEWETAGPIWLEGFNLFAVDESISGGRGITEMRLFGRFSDEDDFALLVTHSVPANPYFPSRFMRVQELLAQPFVGWQFRAEFDQFGEGAFKGPRIEELDAIGETVTMVPSPADIVLQNATASGSQGGFPVSNAIDGVATGGGGWAGDMGGFTPALTAAFETRDNIGSDLSTRLSFELIHTWGSAHSAGRFRISATTDDRSTFADGLINGGDVSANWEVLDVLQIAGTGGETFEILEDGSILVSGAAPSTTTYTVETAGIEGVITGFRLEMLEHPSLPTSGPGRASNGNWVLTEFRVSYNGGVPVPNRAPRGTPDSLDVTEGFPATTGNLLANDFDPDGDPLSVASFTQPAHGSVVHHGNGTFTFTAEPGFTGADGFTYTPTDGFQNGAPTEVVVAVHPSDVIIWTNPAGGSFSDPANWNPARVPTGTDRAVINHPGTYVVTLNANVSFTSLETGGPGSDPTLRQTGGTLNLAEDSTVLTYELAGGTLRGNSTLGIESRFTWTGGTMRDTGKTALAATATGTISGATNKGLDGGRILENAGTLTVTSANVYFNLNNFGGGAVINNLAGATLEVPGATAFTQSTASPGSAVYNAGLFRKTGAGEARFSANVAFNNTGSVEVGQGGLWFQASASLGGTFALADGTLLRLAGTAFALDAGAEFTGDGIVLLQSGTLTVEEEDSALPRFTQSGGTLRGTGSLTVTDIFTWTGGTMRDTGKTALAATATGTISGATNKGLDEFRILENAGSLTVSSTFVYFNLNNFGGGAVINNLAGATLEVPGATAFTQNNASPGSALNNAGIFRKTGAGEARFSANVAFNNTGSVEVGQGGLWFQASASLGGTFSLADGTLLRLAGTAFALNAGAEFTGDGIVLLQSGTLTVEEEDSALPRFTQSGGTLRGTGTLTVTDTFVWTGGTMRNAGKTVIGPAATGTISGGTNKGLDEFRILENAGSLAVSANVHFNLNNFGGGGVIDNLAGATMEAQGNTAFLHNFVSPGSAVNNAGLFRKTGGGETRFSNSAIAFNNTGTVELVSGSLRPDGGFTQAGILTGSGGITGGFTNSGIVRPGAPSGIITVSGSFAQAAAGRLEIEIAGPDPGSGYDRLQVGAAAALNGTLAITMLDAFIPEDGAQFGVLTFGSRSGDFATVEGINQNGFSFDRTFTGNEMLLTAIGGAEAGGLAVFGISAASYDDWRLQTFSEDQRSTPGTCGPLEDADGDGLCNLLEFAFAGDPLNPNCRKLPRVTIIGDEGRQYLEIEYRRRKTGPLRYHVETSGDLATWHTNHPEFQVTETISVRQLPAEPGIEEITQRDLTPIEAGTRRFIRLRVDK